MSINQSDLTKGQLRKLNALCKSVGHSLGEEAFRKWFKQQKTGTKNGERADPVAQMIAEALAPVAKKNVNLGRHGYSVKRAKGKGASGIVVERIEQA